MQPHSPAGNLCAPGVPARGLVVALGAYACVGAAISFSGWPLDIPRRTDWQDSGVSTQPNTCILLFVTGTALILSALSRWRLVSALGCPGCHRWGDDPSAVHRWRRLRV